MNPQTLNLTKAAYSVRELVELLPLGRNSIYEAVKSGDLKVTKFGKRTMFLAPHVVEFLQSLSSSSAAAPSACKRGAER
jgi:hypothetical protein